ncbi:MAG: extracellular solute-binding protein [Rhizobiales bacterium]|nr:extracellular solute-binding protein [Hyphomicrobiales bacterium]
MRISTGSLALFASSTVALLAAPTLGHAQNLTPQEQKLIAAAKKEGAVTLLNPLFSDRTGQLLGEAFVKRYNLGPEFKFNNLRKGTGQTVAQVRQEIVAGRFTVDILLVSAPGFFEEANKRGAFDSLDSAYWKDHETLAKKAGQYFNYPNVVIPLAYTFQPVWNASCPGMENFNVTSYADVATPALKGKTIASDLTKSITYTNTVISLMEDKATDITALWTKLKATDPIVEFRTEPKMQMVITCQRPFDMWNLAGRVYQNVLKKPDLAKVLKVGSYKEGQVMLGNQAAVIKGAPHPNAGKLLIDFMLSKEGTDILVEGEAIDTFRANYTPPAAAKPFLLDLSKHKLLGMKDWVASAKQAKPVRDAWQAVFQ